MPIIACPQCQRKLRVGDEHSGRVVQCPACEAQFTAELPIEPAAAEGPAAAPTSATQLACTMRVPERIVPEDLDDHEPRRRRHFPDMSLPDDAKNPRAGRGRKLLLLLLGVGGVVGLLALAGWGLNELRPHRRQPRPFVRNEHPADRRRDIVDAFHNQKPLKDDEIVRELQPLFVRLGAAIQSRNEQGIRDEFNADRMLDELDSQNILPKNRWRNDREFARGLSTGIGRALAQKSGEFRWVSTEIRHVKNLDGNEAIVIARHRGPDGDYLKLRWWVTKESGSWQVFDLEELTTGIRVSTAIGMAASGGLGGANDLSRAMNVIQAANAAVRIGDPAGAERQLQQIAGTALPPFVEALRNTTKGLIQLHRGNFELALAEFDRAGRFNLDMPLIRLLRGIALHRLKRWEEALVELNAVWELLGDDDGDLCIDIATAHHNLSHFPEAARFYRLSLDQNPNEIDAFVGLIRTARFEKDGPHDAVRIAKTSNPGSTFKQLADECRECSDFVGMDALADAMRRVDPKSSQTDYYQAVAKARLRRFEQARTLFQAALKKEQAAAKRKEYVNGFMQAMMVMGHWAEVYASAPDPVEAFHAAVAEFSRSYRIEDFRRLVRMHQSQSPADPMLKFAQGEIAVRDEDFKRADAAFDAGMASPPDDATLAQFRASRVTARFHVGRMARAYERIGPRDQTFVQLANLCLDNDDFKQLELLLKLHEKNAPGSPDLMQCRTRMLARQGKTAEATEMLKSTLAKQKNDEDKERLIGSFLFDMHAAGKWLDGYRAAPDAKAAFNLLADSFLDDGDWKKLRALVDAHQAREPNDPRLPEFAAEVLGAEKKWTEAANVLDRAWKKADAEQRKHLQWSYGQALCRAGNWSQAYRAIEPAGSGFISLASLMIADKKLTELQALIQIHRNTSPDDADISFFEAELNFLKGKPLEAIPLIQKAYLGQKLDYRKTVYLSTLFQRMQEAGQPLKGYEASPDKSVAFVQIGRQFVDDKNAKDLAELLRLHRKTDSNSDTFEYLTGQLHLLRGEASQAEASFLAAQQKSGAEDFQYRDAWLHARVRAGKAVATCRKPHADAEIILDLMGICVEERDSDQLAALITLRRQEFPEDPNLTTWDLDLLWLKKDYAAIVKLANDHGPANALPFRRQWRFNDCLIRSLVRLHRSRDAAAELERVKPRDSLPLLRVLVQAARGDVAQTIQTMEAIQAQPAFVAQCYSDDDLGPILKSPAFKAFRDRFPQEELPAK